MSLKTVPLTIFYEIHGTTKLNCLHRFKSLCKLNSFRTVQYSFITSQYEYTLLYLKEKRKYLKYLGATTFPVGMETIHKMRFRQQFSSTKFRQIRVTNSISSTHYGQL